MTAAIAAMVCGCYGTHKEACDLGAAEAVVLRAMAANPQHELSAALTALFAEGLLRELRDDDPEDLVDGLLDSLYDLGLIGGQR